MNIINIEAEGGVEGGVERTGTCPGVDEDENEAGAGAVPGVDEDEDEAGPPPVVARESSDYINVDVRERALLREMGDAARAVQLLLGDVEIVVGGERRLVIERKTLADLAASIKDGRYREQKARLLGNVAASGVMYVIETGVAGFALPGFAFDDRMRSIGGIQPATLQGSVVSMLVCSGLRVVFTRDVADTAALVRRIAARQGREEGEGKGKGLPYADVACDSAIAAKRGANVDPAACFRRQMCQVPGVSLVLANTLCGEFGSMAALYARLSQLSVAERQKALSALPLIGSKTAAKLERYMFQAA